MPITSLSPASAAPGVALTIRGASLPTDGQVRFTGLGKVLLATPVSATITEIVATVPDLDGMGGAVVVDVLAADGTPTNGAAFALTAVPLVELVRPLCSLGMVKLLLGIPADDTALDATLQQMILGASATIAGESRVEFRLVQRAGELYDGPGGSMLPLRHTPVVTLAAVSIYGQAVDVSELKVYPTYIAFDDEASDYNARLRGTARIFPRGSQNVSVSYTSGYAAVPGEIANACVLQVVHIRNTINKSGIVSETNSVANSATTYAQVGLAPAAVRAVNRYRKSRVVVV